jgi:hypothetical protein
MRAEIARGAAFTACAVVSDERIGRAAANADYSYRPAGRQEPGSGLGYWLSVTGAYLAAMRSEWCRSRR